MFRFSTFARSPIALLNRILCKFNQRDDAPQVLRLRAVTDKSPLILQIETTNVCNASCVFCAYANMKRKKGVMSLPLFGKIVEDYVAMGGGPVSLTPIMGDPLLDPHLLERLQILRSHPEITQITLTTNAIALDNYSDGEVSSLLTNLDSIMLSIGGLDAATYREMYGVDKYRQVLDSADRLLRIRESVARPAPLAFAFRTKDRSFYSEHRQLLNRYRKLGVFVSHISDYANFSGALKEGREGKISVIAREGEKRSTCIFPRISMCICWDGTITACGCADFEGTALTIGHAEKDALAEVWSGTKRRLILESFPKGCLTNFCRLCSAYQPDTIGARSYFKEVSPHRPLPLDFFHQFWGG